MIFEDQNSGCCEWGRGHLTQPAVPRGRYSTTIFTSLGDLSRSPGLQPVEHAEAFEA